MPKNLTHLGEFFREDFQSPFHVAQNKGVITSTEINNGAVFNNNADKIVYPPALLAGDRSEFSVRIVGTFNAAASSNFGAILSVTFGGSGAQQPLFISKSGATNKLLVRTADGTNNKDFNSTADLPSTPVDILCVFKSLTWTVYLNGEAWAGTNNGSMTGKAVFSQATSFQIGNALITATVMQGTCKSVQLFEKALTADEVVDLYENSTFAYMDNLAMYYPLNDQVGTSPYTTTDVVGGKHLTLGSGVLQPTKLTGINGFQFTNDSLTNSAINKRILSGFIWFSFNGDTTTYQNLINFDSDKLSVFYKNLTGTGFIIKTDGNPGSNIFNVEVPQGINMYAFSINETTGLVSSYLNGKLVNTATKQIYTGNLTTLELGNQAGFYWKNNIYQAGFSETELTEIQARDIYFKGYKYLGN